MRKLFVVAALLSFIACQKDVVVQPAKKTVKVKTVVVPNDGRNVKIDKVLPMGREVIERSSLGGKLGKDGTVYESQETFKAGEPVYVTMWLKESPGGLQTSVLFSDAKGKQVDWPRKQMNGEKVATFKLDTTKLAPGEYHAQCFWGLNIEREYAFKVAKR